ncbi:MAG TPA: XRE family transcriptional regulator [Wenzhouxiangella sp.]
MAKPFKKLRDNMPLEARKTASNKAQQMMQDMLLAELRQARKLSQEQIAGSLHVKQASVSKLERRTDMYISTLRNFIKAMGGELEITAKFPDGIVRIQQFEDLDESSKASAKA